MKLNKNFVIVILIIINSIAPFCLLYNCLDVPKSLIEGIIYLKIKNEDVVAVEHNDILFSNESRKFVVGYNTERMIKRLEEAGDTFYGKVDDAYVFTQDDRIFYNCYTEKMCLGKYKVWEKHCYAPSFRVMY